MALTMAKYLLNKLNSQLSGKDNLISYGIDDYHDVNILLFVLEIFICISFS